MADNLADGRKIRLLTIVDNFSRECLALDVASGFKGGDVVQALTRVTTALSSSQKRSIDGRLGTKCNSISRDRARRPTMRLSNRSMGAFVKNSSTQSTVLACVDWEHLVYGIRAAHKSDSLMFNPKPSTDASRLQSSTRRHSFRPPSLSWCLRNRG